MKLCRVYDAGSTRKHPDHCKCGAPVAWHHPCANDPAPHFLIGNLPLRSSREISLFGQATAVLPSAFWRHLKFRIGRRHAQYVLLSAVSSLGGFQTPRRRCGNVCHRPASGNRHRRGPSAESMLPRRRCPSTVGSGARRCNFAIHREKRRPNSP
jgi:hypothetical protein